MCICKYIYLNKIKALLFITSVLYYLCFAVHFDRGKLTESNTNCIAFQAQFNGAICVHEENAFYLN